QPEGLKQLIALYIGRCHPCWKDPDVVRWLEKNVKEVIKRVDDGDPLAEEYRKKRQGRYRGTPRNIFRHILISEIKDATAALPPHLANTPVMSYDPLPPEDSISSYERPPARQTRAQQESNPLTAFFRSMLPNFNPQEVPDVPDGAVGGAAAPTDMQAGIGALMEAMRDLLNNIRPVDAPREDGQGGDEFDDQDNNPEWD
ncbi:transcription factor 25-like, partial [Lingula anatina]